MKHFIASGLASRQRIWIAAAAIAAIALVGLGGVVVAHMREAVTPVASVSKPSTCEDAYHLMALRPSQVAAAKPVCLVQSLKFSGELTGAVSQSFPVSATDVGPTAMCIVPKRWEDFPQALLAMAIGG